MKSAENFIGILDALRSEDVDFIIISGIAVILHGMPRFSEDVDIVIKMTENNICRIRKVLNLLYDDKDIKESTLKRY